MRFGFDELISSSLIIHHSSMTFWFTSKAHHSSLIIEFFKIDELGTIFTIFTNSDNNSKLIDKSKFSKIIYHFIWRGLIQNNLKKKCKKNLKLIEIFDLQFKLHQFINHHSSLTKWC
jgi:hypothetical protein